MRDLPTLSPTQFDDAKWAFSTRRVDVAAIRGLSPNLSAAVAGDLVLAEVVRPGQHRKLQLACGRFSELMVGDRIVAALGDRYAPDQFHAVATLDAAEAHLVAGGGVIGRVVAAHDAMKTPTALRPLGLLRDAQGTVANVAAYALPAIPMNERITVIGVVGASMNSGKTTTTASLALGLRRAGRRVMAIKLTGTGAFGDIHAFLDAGVEALDFTDVGMATTYRMPLARIEAGFATLVATCAQRGAEVVVCELADGLFQSETRALLAGGAVRRRLDGLLFAAPDALAAYGAAQVLGGMRLQPLAISGLLTCSPLAMAEAAEMTGLPILRRDDLADPEVAAPLIAPCLRGGSEADAA